MKYRDLVLYAVSFLALSLFLLTPLAADPSVMTDFPGSTLCQDIYNKVDNLVVAKY